MLAEQNANMMIIDMGAGGDIDTNVFSGIEKCDTFLVFGTSGYGADTGNQASTFYEYKHAFALKKRIVLIRMIPFGQNFEELQGRVTFNANKLILTWIEGEPMPPSLVADILRRSRTRPQRPRPLSKQRNENRFFTPPASLLDHWAPNDQSPERRREELSF